MRNSEPRYVKSAVEVNLNNFIPIVWIHLVDGSRPTCNTSVID